MHLPDVVALAVGLAVPDEARAGLIEEHVALGAAETSGVPLEVRRDAQDVLVVDGAAATGTVGRLLTCTTGRKKKMTKKH